MQQLVHGFCILPVVELTAVYFETTAHTTFVTQLQLNTRCTRLLGWGFYSQGCSMALGL